MPADTPSTETPTITDKAATPVVVPSTPDTLPGVDDATQAHLDAIEVDLRGTVRATWQITDDPDEYEQAQWVEVSDLPSIISAWATAALPHLTAAKDNEIASLRAKLDTAYQIIGEQALIDMEEPIPPFGSPERAAREAALRGEQGE